MIDSTPSRTRAATLAGFDLERLWAWPLAIVIWPAEHLLGLSEMLVRLPASG